MEKEKALGLDKFNTAFYQECWFVVKDDLMVFEEFYHNGRIPTSMDSTFTTLVPKKYRSIKARDFGPISLVSSIYKIIAKVLSMRLGTRVLGILPAFLLHILAFHKLITFQTCNQTFFPQGFNKEEKKVDKEGKKGKIHW